MNAAPQHDSTAPVYRGMSRPELDAAYDNAAAVADSGRLLANWDMKSARLREGGLAGAGFRAELDVRYADTERGLLDLFLLERGGRPTLVFVHGGYWHLSSKDRFSFVAEGPLSVGLNVAVIGYDLAPAVTMDAIVAQVQGAIRWITEHSGAWGADPGKVAVAGWSAGGHLAAMAMSTLEIACGLTISGIFDLEPIRLCYLNEKLGLSEDSARDASPLAKLPRRAGQLTISVGGDELPELRRQSADYFDAWHSAGLDGELCVVPGRHHFEVLEELAMPRGVLLDVLRAWRW